MNTQNSRNKTGQPDTKKKGGDLGEIPPAIISQLITLREYVSTAVADLRVAAIVIPLTTYKLKVIMLIR